ncbi:MAG TPA: SurA N-terminal domain-containing protein [Verrucomicrobiae bacterium]|nr:SurA N-terminal domain-containing protein [Verrucomicrobiae bacterium]
MENNPLQQPVSDQGSMNQTEPKASILKKVNYKLILAVVIILGLLALAFWSKKFFIAATIDGKPISRLSVIRELEKQSGKQALEALINERLINNEAKVKGITVTNEELRQEAEKINKQFSDQGSSLDAQLTANNLSREDFDKQITLQKKAEKLLADKIAVTDDEVQKYITDNSITIPEGQDAEYRNQVRDQIKSQKFSQQIATWLSDLRSKAKVDVLVNY